MNDIVFEILKCVLIVITIVITRYLVPLLKNKMKESEHQDVINWVNAAVLWAEQTIKTGGYSKKDHVMVFLSRFLYEKGIDITNEQLDILVEAAVKAMKEG